MALKFADSFDHYATADLLQKWTSGTTGNSITANGRNGSSCMTGTITGSTFLTRDVGGTQDTMIVGVAIKPQNTMAGNASAPFMSFQEGSVFHVVISTDVNGAITAYRGWPAGVSLGASSNGVIAVGAFYYVEAKVKVHDTTGTVEVKVNGTTVLNLTSQDTRVAATGFIDRIGILASCSINPIATYFDDLYCCDTTGIAPCNDFLGDVRVDALFPTADGNYSQLTTSTGSSHYVLVDEATPNTSDYNSSATSGNRDTYAMGDLATSSTTYFAVQALVAALKDSASASSAQTCIRSGSTDSTGVSTALATTQSYLRDVYATDPNTSAAWTFAGINAMEAGMNVTVSGANARASQVVVEAVRSSAAPAAYNSNFFFVLA